MSPAPWLAPPLFFTPLPSDPSRAEPSAARREGLSAWLPLLPLRYVLALSLAGLGLASTLALAILVTREATARLEAEAGIQLSELAQHTARALDQGMFERWRDMQIAASLDTLHDAAAPAEAKRAVLERLQRTYPAYSIIGLVDPDGRIQVTSNRLLEGADVSHRDYFLTGRERSFVGDVHDAFLLAKLLPKETGEPLRLVDFATPVVRPDGTLAGVLAAHLNWQWARETADALMRPLKGRREGAEILVVARDGTVLLGPPALQGRVLATEVLDGGRRAERAGTSHIGPWPDSKGDYVSAVEWTNGFRDYPGLGWRVAVRHRADQALRPVSELRRDILISGSAVALIAALLAWAMAGGLARPLQHLAQVASALGRDEPLPALPAAIVWEHRMVASALASTATELRQRETARRMLVDELNHRVKNTLAVVQSIAAQTLRSTVLSADASAALEERLLALSRTHDVLTRESWEGADLAEVVDQAIAPFRSPNSVRIEIAGPAVRLCPRTVLAIAMALQELATNAVKYGALSNATGIVRIAWNVAVKQGGTRLCLSWQEAGGPPVMPPTRRGFGSRLIERSLARDLGNAVVLTFAPTGVCCTLETDLS